jgi:hypothetical protein
MTEFLLLYWSLLVYSVMADDGSQTISEERRADGCAKKGDAIIRHLN